MYAPAQWFDLTLVGESDGQAILNKFYYARGESDLPGIFGILDPAIDFEAIVLPSILAVVSSQTTFTEIIVNEHVSGFATGTYGLPSGTVGTNSGDQAPTFVAWAFKSNRTSRSVPSAHKRFGRLTEGMLLNGFAESAMVTPLNTLATALGQSFTSFAGGTTDLYPVAISTMDNSVSPSVPRPVPLFEPILTWVYQKVTSQVSRRP